MARRKTEDVNEVEVSETGTETQKFWVVAKQEQRMRAGLQFTKEPREVELTEEQHKAISADPLLAFTAAPRPADNEAPAA